MFDVDKIKEWVVAKPVEIDKDNLMDFLNK